MFYKPLRLTKTYNRPEKLIEHQIEGVLRRNGYYVQKLQSGMIKTENRMIKMGVAGTPDLMAFKKVYPVGASIKASLDLLFIECKAPGKKPTPLQKAKMEELETYGARCYVCTSTEDVEAIL